MDEYIKREAALALVKPDAPEDEKAAVTIATAKKLVRNIVLRTPAADVAPVRHGRWENGNPICPVCGGDKFKDLDADIWCDWKPAFCPNCGADMRGINDE